MRTALLIAALACASVACAGASAETGQESRYGPAPERAPTPVNGGGPGYTGAPYSGRALGWSGKREIVAPQAQAQAPAQPYWARQAQQAQQPQQPPTARTAYPPPAPAYAPQAPSAPLPRNIYDTPAPRAAAPVPVAYSAPVQPAPQFRDGQIGARTYSVGRQFGMAPDPIPAAGPPRMVLIAPPPAPDEDKPRDGDNGEWSAKPEKDNGQ
jgi:hypothetical protein